LGVFFLCLNASSSDILRLRNSIPNLSNSPLLLQAVAHLSYTHFATEPFLIAFRRRLPPANHLSTVIRRHMRETFAINELGRRTLVVNNGQFDRITSLGLNVSRDFVAPG